MVDLFAAVDDMRTGYHRAGPDRQDELWSAMVDALYAVSDRPLTVREWLISTWWDIRARLYWMRHRNTR